ncbi:hypothetical protein CA54_28160 [Symmachiella macrocystis]|uniref:HEAT repeat domain-containing protein n=1 Tax=Symmachiella macrocystis TaxID=2527985 RepID=A0A5C6BTF5_9PLAN|nr:hypothetical protein [Symmachiella macrocystis]TWU13974.1 hypothetical protein CA54_28160 [Symmachiella macrocystis]
MRIARQMVMLLALGIATFVSTAEATLLACPFCSAPSLTFSEQLATADAAVLVQWVSAKKGNAFDDDGLALEDPTKLIPASTTYKITQVLRNTKEKTLKKGQKIDLARFRSAKKGDLFLILGTQGNELEWGSPIEVTETSFNYIAQAPSPESDQQKRLAYFLKFLEFPDEMIANDAYAEFANAPYKDIAQLTDQLPREKLAGWITNDDTPATRLGLYGLLLGLCGKESDAELMQNKITEETEQFRLGMDGIIGGYLLLSGEEGLKVIEQTKFVKNPDKKVPFSETYAAMQALRFVWKYADDRFEPERLRQSMRILLERPELADLVIADLARWKDWSVLEQLMALYDAEEYNVPSVKRAIVRYLLTCSKDDRQGEDIQPPPRAADAEKALAVLRQKDPRTVKEAERFFIIN